MVAFQRRAEPGSDGWLERRDGVGVLGYGIVIPYPGRLALAYIYIRIYIAYIIYMHPYILYIRCAGAS